MTRLALEIALADDAPATTVAPAAAAPPGATTVVPLYFCDQVEVGGG